MMLIGVDCHPSFQTIAFFVEETGECGELELNHSDGQADRFYRDLKQRGVCVLLVGGSSPSGSTCPLPR
jgi:transposase